MAGRMSHLSAWRQSALRARQRQLIALPSPRRAVILLWLAALVGGAMASPAAASRRAGEGPGHSTAVRYGAPPSSTSASGGTGSGPPAGGGGSGSSGAGWGSAGGGKGTGRRGNPSPGPLGRKGMWIWYVSASNNGNLKSIIATAHRYGVGTLIIKSGDGTSYWSQFTSSLVKTLHAAGLGVCAWQFVYGVKPTKEAKVAAQAAQAGADCLLIDAESQYEGKYVQAQKYMRELRTLVGANFRIGLASFPYVDFHPSFPYSVFLGPGGAQFDVPQMYWQDIGDSPGTVYAHTFSFNTPYQRSILPLGQTYNSPPPGQVKRFRQLRWTYHARGISWFDWQSTSPQTWQALRAPIKKLNAKPQTQLPTLSVGSPAGTSDLVVWAQEHLVKAGYRGVTIDGSYGPQTQHAVLKFQAAHHLPRTGEVDPATWTALLRYPAAKVTWTNSGATTARAGALTLPPPVSARLPAVAYEIPPHLGAGHPGRVSP